MSNKRFTDNDWSDLQKLFNQWCLEEGKVSVNGYYEAKLRDKPFPSLSGFEKRAREHGWKAIAQKLLDRIAGPVKKAKKELEEIESKKRVAGKEVSTIVIDPKRPKDEQKAIDYVIAHVQTGLASSVKAYVSMTSIVENHFTAIKSLQELPMVDTEGKEVLDPDGNRIMKPIDPFIAQSCNALASALDKMHNVMRKSVSGSDEALKSLFSLEEKVIQQTILHKEQAKNTGKKTDESENMKTTHEWFKEQQRIEGIPIK